MVKRSSIFKSCFLVFLCSLCSFAPVSAALPEGTLNFYAQNNILFYDPSSYRRACTKLEETDAKSIIWNFLNQEGFSDEQIAGILGNAEVESGLNPVRKSNSNYWGLFQWDETNRWPKIKYAINEAGLSQYLSEPYISGGPAQIPLEDLKTLLTIELKAALEEERNGWVAKTKEAKSPEEASDIFLVLFEGAEGGENDVIEYYEPYNGKKYQAAARRRTLARSYFDTYSESHYCLSNPYDPLVYLQQYIIDTNKRYNKNYPVPQSYEINQLVPSPLDDSPTGVYEGCWMGTFCGQCTALSGWFMMQYTSYEYYSGTGGGGVVGNIIRMNPELSSSNTPTPFSIFSTKTHTGLVLSVLDNGEILTVENHMGKEYTSNEFSLEVRQYTPGSDYVFVDVSEGVDLSNLGSD